jgi:uncharacterized protein (UPF0264 family)
MDLLVSVRDEDEAAAALAGGGDIIDAKDPFSGALGPVSLAVLRRIHAVVAGRRPVTAALGDAVDEGAIARDARAYVESGASLVKVGFAGIGDAGRVGALLEATVRGAHAARRSDHDGVVAVGYADAHRAASLPPTTLVDLAATAGARGVLLDTADKNGPGVLELLSIDALRGWIDRAHHAGLRVALAGRVSLSDLPVLQDLDADIVGVRGAACEGGRTGRVTADRVRGLRDLLRGGYVASGPVRDR